MRQRPVRHAARDLTTSDGSAPAFRHCRQRRGAAGIACRCRPRTVPAGTTDLRISAAGTPARLGERRACRTAGAGGVSTSTPARAYLLIDALQWLLGSRGRWRSPQPRIPGASRLDWRCDDAGTAPDHARRAIGPHGITATRDGLQAARSALAQACDARSGSASAGAKRKAQPMKAGLYRWWRWAELNRRPKALHPRHYMLSSPLYLAPEQHGAQSASQNQPALSSLGLTGSHPMRFRDDDPTQRARTQAVSGLRP